MKTEYEKKKSADRGASIKQQKGKLSFILCEFAFLVAILLLSYQVPFVTISSKTTISTSEQDQEAKTTILNGVSFIIKQAYAQKQDKENNITNNETNSTIKYIKTAAQLLGQVSTEYKNGNFSKADELATIAYLDNFEYVEPILEKRGAKNLMEEIEHMMRTEIRDMIKNKVPQDKLDLEVGTIRGKLLDAISVLESSK
jgi:hypothetical protein